MIAALILSAAAVILLAAVAAPLIGPEPVTPEPAPHGRGPVAVVLPYAARDEHSAVREALLIAHVHLSLYAGAWRLPAALPAPVFAGAAA